MNRDFETALSFAENLSAFLRASGRFPFCGRGDINTYTLFVESMRNTVSTRGRVGCVVPSGLATDDTTKFFFQELMQTESLASFFDFENKALFFPDVAPVMRFALVTISGKGVSKATRFLFFGISVNDATDPEKTFDLTSRELAQVNPNTGNCPTFRSRREALIAFHIYARVPILSLEREQPPSTWPLPYLRMFDMTNDSSRFRTRSELLADGFIQEQNALVRRTERFVPLYEAKMVQQFDHRNGTFDGTAESDMFKTKAATITPPAESKRDPTFLVSPRYWIDEHAVRDRAQEHEKKWLLAFRDVIQPMTNARCAIFAALPLCGLGNNIPTLLSPSLSAVSLSLFLANANSFVFDFCTRQKIGGAHLNLFILKQLPTLPLPSYSTEVPWGIAARLTTGNWVRPRTLELTFAAWDLEAFGLDCGYDGPPFRWDDGRRFLIRCELDAAYFHLYGIERDDVDYILETFPIVKRKDIARTEVKDNSGEVTQEGRYRTKDTILEIYDEMAECIAANAAANGEQPVASGEDPTAGHSPLTTRPNRVYLTRLDPPPGPPADAEGNFLPLPQWLPGQRRPADWPPHIHGPKEVYDWAKINNIDWRSLLESEDTERVNRHTSGVGDTKP